LNVAGFPPQELRTDGLDEGTALIVGVTSHRDIAPAQLPALRVQVRDALAMLRGEFPGLRLVVLSALAEGGDRIVAEEGLALGARLVVPLPMPVESYAQDFAGAESRQAFDALLRAAQVITLPQHEDPELVRVPGPQRDRQYLLAGLFVANHCHLLMALWDGRDNGGTGGTAQVVRYYLGGPVPGARRATDNLRKMLAGDDDSLVLHLPVRRESQSGEGPPAGSRWLSSGASRAFAPDAPVAGMPAEYRRIFERMRSFAGDLQRHDAATDGTWAGDPAERAWHRVDAMAVDFQRHIAWTMRAIHGLAILMGLAFLLYADLGAPDWMLWCFLLLFATGVAIATTAHRREWHRKYIDYRALAEGLRVQAFWRRAGLTITGDPEFAHDNFMQKQDVELGWIRNVMRQVGLWPQPPVTDARAAVEEVIDAWVGRPGQSGQLAYYERKAALRERHHLRTQALGKACLWSGVAISVVLALFHGGLPGATRNLLVTTMGALSLVAAVREAYAYRKADRELVKQYRFMHRIYRNARCALDAAKGTQEKREILRALGEAALAEHAEWALVHRDRPVEHGRP